MKIVIAVDSFKGSMSSLEAGEAVKEGILRAMDADIVVKPIADGGEGTTDALVAGLGGEKVPITVTGPRGNKVEASYGWLRETGTAIIEMAEAAGIVLLGSEKKEPLKATSYGVGEMIRDAMDRGCRDFLIGIGGSATNDGGVGMLQALGFGFYDGEGKDVGLGAQCLERIVRVDTARRHPGLGECTFRVACDVKNPLTGENGATRVYGPQKGVSGDMLQELDRAMGHYAEVTKAATGRDEALTAGAGAAGGMGFAFLSYLDGALEPGVDLVLEALELEESMRDADFVVTGEGCLDHQTAMGKVPVGVARLAKKHGAKVVALAGGVKEGAQACNREGIDAFFSINPLLVPLEEAMRPEVARKNMATVAEQVFRLVAAMR
ncbi:glycerate kinase [Anaerotalea alkaliphila]|uniref:Glycerate kinase n=1 Tax=Anaerotalea alkaliphila TaxID=2662126 RepID=A0A7X5HVW3_9FIRM|nr:glycerate kinase [Anaerotalea alkaliphila]NDL67558.1 glycerate kinase [Anaerotalea alkaliphila]